jgi:arylsulfatase A-like enzyme
MSLMPSRTGARVLALLAGALALLSAGSPRPRVTPNVVLVSIDTVGRFALRIFAPGARALPELDGFLRRSVAFDRAYSTAGWTLPAHGSLLTGLYPDRHGATDPREGLSAPVATLATLLGRAGFRSAAFTDGGFVDRRFGFAAGFDRYDDWTRTRDWPSLRIPRGGKPSAKRKHAFDRSLAFLRDPSLADAPFFLFVHTYLVHDYYLRLPPRPFRGCVLGREPCAAPEWERLRRAYDDELAHIDGPFGRLVSAVERLPRPTYLILVSDHGEGFDPAHGRTHHGGRLHEDLLRIPLAVAGPGLTPRLTDEPVSLVDVVPTVLELVGLSPPPGSDGSSFAPALHGRPLPRRALYAMEHYYSWQDGARREAETVQPSPLAVAVVEGDRWYVHDPGSEALYDMTADPRQLQPLPGAAAGSLARLAAARLGSNKPHTPAAVDEALRDRLRALGYVE